MNLTSINLKICKKKKKKEREMSLFLGYTSFTQLLVKGCDVRNFISNDSAKQQQ